jgi:hypothetical protein
LQHLTGGTEFPAPLLTRVKYLLRTVYRFRNHPQAVTHHRVVIDKYKTLIEKTFGPTQLDQDAIYVAYSIQKRSRCKGRTSDDSQGNKNILLPS